MRAAVYLGARTFAVQERREPAPTAGHVAIDVAYTGICGTDLHIFHGHMDHRVTAPAVIGHEMAGRVAAVGEGVDGWAAGDRRHRHAPRQLRPVPGLSIRAHPPLPSPALPRHRCDRLDAEPLDRARRGARPRPRRPPARARGPGRADRGRRARRRRADLQPGERVLVVGGGPIGLLIALVARRAGADVLLLEPNPHRRAVAEAVGTATADPLAHDITRSSTDGRAVREPSAAFEVSGSQAGMDLAVSAAGGAGTARARRHPPAADTGRSAPLLLARAHAGRRPPVPARRLRCRGRPSSPTASCRPTR